MKDNVTHTHCTIPQAPFNSSIQLSVCCTWSYFLFLMFSATWTAGFRYRHHSVCFDNFHAIKLSPFGFSSVTALFTIPKRNRALHDNMKSRRFLYLHLLLSFPHRQLSLNCLVESLLCWLVLDIASITFCVSLQSS